MVEISKFFEQEEMPVALNGHVAEPAEEPKKARVDARRGVFITSRGDEIHLSSKPISSLLIERVLSEGKPHIPMVEVTLLGKHKQLEAHPEHAGYKALLAEWETESKMRLMRYICIVGVKGETPEAFIAENREFFPNATANEWKYMWVVSLVPDEDIDVFTEAVIGNNIPTAKGLAESAESFRSET